MFDNTTSKGQLTQWQTMQLYSLLSVITNAAKSGERRVYISVEQYGQIAGQLCELFLFSLRHASTHQEPEGDHHGRE